MKRLIVKPNDLGIGYDVGWSVWSPLDEKWCECWWGNTKNADSFRSMTEDARRQGYVFDPGDSALNLLSEKLENQEEEWAKKRK